MRNLLDETVSVISKEGYRVEDIIFIGSLDSGYRCSWGEFKDLANLEYDNGYGCQEVAQDLCIVFSDGSKLIRAEYDGSEWWEMIPVTNIPEESKKIKRLTNNCGWKSLSEINGD